MTGSICHKPMLIGINSLPLIYFYTDRVRYSRWITQLRPSGSGPNFPKVSRELPVGSSVVWSHAAKLPVQRNFLSWRHGERAHKYSPGGGLLCASQTPAQAPWRFSNRVPGASLQTLPLSIARLFQQYFSSSLRELIPPRCPFGNKPCQL